MMKQTIGDRDRGRRRDWGSRRLPPLAGLLPGTSRSMRLGHRKPPAILTAAKARDQTHAWLKPNRAPPPLPAAIKAPTMITEEIAFGDRHQRQCKAGVTRQTT